jgi:hypothetical protein
VRPRSEVTRRRRQRLFVVGTNAELLRHAAGLFHRSSKYRGIGVVDGSGADRFARGHDLVARGDDSDAGLAIDLEPIASHCGEHADLARGYDLPGAGHRFAARDVAAGEGDELSSSNWAMNLDCRLAVDLPRLGILHHDHRVGAARDDAAGRDEARHAGPHRQARRDSGSEDFRVQPQDFWRLHAASYSVARTDRKSVGTRAIESRHIDLGDHRLC